MRLVGSALLVQQRVSGLVAAVEEKSDVLWELEDLEAGATEDELAAEQAAARSQTVRSFERKRPARKSLPG